MDAASTVTIKTFSDQMDADLAAAELERAGIRCILVNDDAAGMLPFLRLGGGIRLMVDKEDAKDAKEILQTHSGSGQPGGDPQNESSTQRLKMPESTTVGMVLGLTVGLLVGISATLIYKQLHALRSYDYTYDSDGDGQPDDKTHYARGYPVWRQMDQNFDRRVDYWEYYDAQGQVERSEMDNNFDGRVDSWGRFRFNQCKEIIADTDFNGVPDVTYSYSGGVITNIDWRPNGTNIVTVREIYPYGVLSEQLRDLDYNGQFDISVKFDPLFRPTLTNHLGR